MDSDAQRDALRTLAEQSGDSLSRLSRLLGRNAAYLQQFVQRGTPRVLREEDRRTLARWFGVPEAALGGPSGVAAVAVARLDVRAAAGAGAPAADRPDSAAVRIDPAFLRGVAGAPEALALIEVQGDSMAPTLEHGDSILVDTGDRTVGAGIHVVRLGGELVVKRVRRDGGELELLSDNPRYSPIAIGTGDRLDVIGRVVWLSRRL